MVRTHRVYQLRQARGRFGSALPHRRMSLVSGVGFLSDISSALKSRPHSVLSQHTNTATNLGFFACPWYYHVAGHALTMGWYLSISGSLQCVTSKEIYLLLQRLFSSLQATMPVVNVQATSCAAGCFAELHRKVQCSLCPISQGTDAICSSSHLSQVYSFYIWPCLSLLIFGL